MGELRDLLAKCKLQVGLSESLLCVDSNSLTPQGPPQQTKSDSFVLFQRLHSILQVAQGPGCGRASAWCRARLSNWTSRSTRCSLRAKLRFCQCGSVTSF